VLPTAKGGLPDQLPQAEEAHMESSSLKSGRDEESGFYGKPPGLVAVIAGNAIVFIAAIVQGAVYWSILPDELPAHFDWQGNNVLDSRLSPPKSNQAILNPLLNCRQG
jgi:hypothetical protein